MENDFIGDKNDEGVHKISQSREEVPKVFFAELKRLVQQTLGVKIDDWPDEQQLLEGNIKHDVAAKSPGVPTCVAQHKWSNVHRAQKNKQTQPQTGLVLVLPTFFEEQKAKNQAVNEEDEQEAALGCEFELHG